jgi:hypothetical protein
MGMDNLWILAQQEDFVFERNWEITEYAVEN